MIMSLPCLCNFGVHRPNSYLVLIAGMHMTVCGRPEILTMIVYVRLYCKIAVGRINSTEGNIGRNENSGVHGPPHGMGHQVNVCFPWKSRCAQAYVSKVTVVVMNCVV